MKLIDKDALVAEIDRQKIGYNVDGKHSVEYDITRKIIDILNTLEVKEVDLNNNGWIDCTKQMPPEEKHYSDTLQGHREWAESDLVLAWDSFYGCRVDATKNGKWMSEQRGGYTGQVVHGIIAWRPIPEFSEELLQCRKENNMTEIKAGNCYMCLEDIGGYDSFTKGKVYSSIYDNALINDNHIDVKVMPSERFRIATDDEIKAQKGK